MQNRTMRATISEVNLDAVFGGFQWQNLPQSSNVEDRRNEPNQWTPTEDGRLVGPHGEWTWDESANQSQPFPYDGTVHPGDVDQDSAARAAQADHDLQANPQYQELQSYVGDALGGHLTPTEDGHLVGSNGHVYDDPSINQNQPAPEHTPEPGEYVGNGDPYPEAPNNGESDPGGSSDGGSADTG